MLGSIVHFVWFLRYLLKSVPFLLGFQFELFLVGLAAWSWLARWIPGPFSWSDLSLLGLGVAIFFSEAWSLFGGLYPWANGILCSATLLCLVLRRRAAIDVLRKGGISILLLTVMVPVLLIAAWNALTSALTCYDVTGYHLQAVRWAAEFGSVPGLANLHGRLGFNSALDPLAALFSSPGGLWLGREFVNSSIVFVTLNVLVQGITAYSARSIYALLLLPFPTSLLFSNCLSSPQPDVAAASAAILFAWYLRDIVLDRESAGASAAFWVFLAGTMAVSFKVSYAALAATGIGVVILCWIRSRLTLRQLIIPSFLTCIFCLPWIARGYITSGYPFFPAAIGRLGFDWAAPLELAAKEQNWIMSWARAPYNLQWQEVLGGWSWLGSWLQQLPTYPIVLKATALTIIGLIFSGWLLRRGYSRSRLIQWTLLFSPIVLSLLFWFFSAPSPRFGQATMWIFAVDLFYLGVIVTTEQTKITRKWVVPVVAIFLAVEIIPGFVRLDAEPLQFPNYVGIGPPMALRRTDTGLHVWVPARGSDSGDWELPVTPPDRLDRKLEQRGPTLRDGFRIRE
jgi:hypothetical protein